MTILEKYMNDNKLTKEQQDFFKKGFETFKDEYLKSWPSHLTNTAAEIKNFWNQTYESKGE